MTAPALVMVSPGTRDPLVTQVILRLQVMLAEMRPEVDTRIAFLAGGTPSLPQVISQFARRRVAEVVLVPLDLTHAITPSTQIEESAARLRVDYPNVALTVSRPLGPEAALLSLLDQRVRAALASARVLELDGLVLSATDCGDMRGSALLARRARQWSTHHRLPCLTAAADGTGPSVSQAIQGLRAQGRRHIAVGSFFLTPDDFFLSQREVALRFGAIAVSDPLGSGEDVLDIVLARYAFAAMDLLDMGENAAITDASIGA